MRTLFYIDMRYTYNILKEMQMSALVACRHSDGYFEKVVAIHPLASAIHPEMRAAEVRRLLPQQLMIQGVAFGCRMPGWLAPVNFLITQSRLLWRIRRIVRKERNAILFTNDAVYSGLFGLALKYLTGKPLVVAIWGNLDEAYEGTETLIMPRLLPSKRLQDFVIRLVLSRADLAVGANRNNLDYMLRRGAVEERSTIFPLWKNLYDGHFSDPASRRGNHQAITRLGLSPNRLYVAYVGRLVPAKLPEDAVKAMKMILEQEPSVEGLVIGDGPQRAELEKLVGEAGLEDRVHFLGNVDQEALSFINPLTISLAPLTGLSLMESALGGAPPVAYERDWHSEFIQDGENGYIVPFRDWQSMAKRAMDIIRNPTLRGRLSAAIRERALALAGREQIYRHEQETFAKLLAKKPGSDHGQVGGSAP